MNVEFGQNLGNSQEAPEATPFKKTPLMRKVEERFALPGEHISQILERMYAVEEKTQGEIAAEFSSGDIQVDRSTVYGWMKMFNPEIPRRTMEETWNNPKQRERMISGMNTAWQDPEKKAEIVKKIHTQESDALRSQAMKDLERSEEVLETARKNLKAAQKASIAIRAKRLTDIFGPDPKQRLHDLIVAEGRSKEEVAQITGLSLATISKLAKKYAVDTTYKRRFGLSTEEITRRKQTIKRVQENGLLESFSERDQRILVALYPEEDIAPTQTQVARDFQISKERVSKIDDAALFYFARIGETKEDTAHMLTDLYYFQNLSMQEIAKILHCRVIVVERAFALLGIPNRG